MFLLDLNNLNNVNLNKIKRVYGLRDFILENYDFLQRCIDRSEIIYNSQFTAAYIYFDDENRNYDLGFL